MQRQPVVAALTPLIGGVYFGRLLAGMQQAARAAGGSLLAVQTFDAGTEFTDFAELRQAGSRVGWEHAHGFVVVLNAVEDDGLTEMLAGGKPVVLVSGDSARGCPAVAPDNAGGVAQAVAHLVGHGHTRIGFAGCLAQSDMTERYEGYRKAMDAEGLVADDAWFFEADDNLGTGGRTAAAAMLAAGMPVSAVVAATDFNALGILEALTESGVSVPHDLAIVGFDDTDSAQHANPSLTTVRQDFAAIGRAAAELVLRQLSGETVRIGLHRVDTELVVRESCGCLDAASATAGAYERAQVREMYDESVYFVDLYGQQFSVSMELLSERERDPHDLAWVRNTSASLAIFGRWTEGRAALETASVYDPGQAFALPLSAVSAAASFPPRELLSPSGRTDEIVFLVPVRAGRNDWGWLCAVAPADTRLNTGRELINQGVALLAVALRVDANRRRVADLGSELAGILEASPDAIARYDAQLRYGYLNRAAAAALGLEEVAIVGRTDRELNRPVEVAERWIGALERVIATASSFQFDFSDAESGETRWHQAHLVPLLDVDGLLVGVLTSTRDISDLKRAEESLAHRAVHDALTGLANRVLFLDRLTTAIARLERQPGTVAVLFIDLDHFKQINDSLGHAAGDQVLVQVADRLRALSRRSDTAARFGGDEFVLLCDRLADDEDVRLIADRVVRGLAQPYVVGTEELVISASVGISVITDPYADVSTVVRNADQAMYSAKGDGRDRFHVFDPDLRDRTSELHALEVDLRHALDRREFRLVYQPLWALASGTVTGVEALLRWHHPVRGIVLPAEFIPLCEQRGLIIGIGAWVLDEACRQLTEWADHARLGRLAMSVNVSGRQLTDPAFVGIVRETFERHAVDPRRITLEITETTLIEDGVVIGHTLAELRSLGVSLALDDFGTGYSSLAHLRDFPVTTLKIDRSFVEKLGGDSRAHEIIGALTAMAHFLDMVVVGEGIEKQSEYDELLALGCDDGQGFLLAHPLTPTDLARLLDEHERDS